MRSHVSWNDVVGLVGAEAMGAGDGRDASREAPEQLRPGDVVAVDGGADDRADRTPAVELPQAVVEQRAGDVVGVGAVHGTDHPRHGAARPVRLGVACAPPTVGSRWPAVLPGERRGDGRSPSDVPMRPMSSPGLPAPVGWAELQARLEAERSGSPFLLFRDGDGRQQLVAAARRRAPRW